MTLPKVRTAQQTSPAIGVVCWAAVASVSVMIATGGFKAVLPAGLASQIGHNAEGFMLVVLIAPWIAYVRARTTKVAPGVVVAISVACLLIGLYLGLGSDVIPLATLDESFYGAALLVPYVWLPRPLPRIAWILPAAAFLIPALFSQTLLGWQLAETYGFWLLVPLYLDFIDRGVLEVDQPWRLSRLVVWITILVVLPVVVSAVRVEEPEGLVQEIFRYLSRPTEAMVAALLLTGYFSILQRIRR